MISLKDQEEHAENVSIITYQMDNINTNQFSQQENVITLQTDAEKQMEEQEIQKDKQEVKELTKIEEKQDKQQQSTEQYQELRWEFWQPKKPESTNKESENSNTNSTEGNDDEKEGFFSKFKKSATFGTFASVASALGAKAALTAAGFSSVGPVAGSFAAGAQAAIGNVAAGSWFAACQSIAMSGAAPFIVPAAAVGVLAGGAYYLYTSENQNPQNNQPGEEGNQQKS